MKKPINLRKFLAPEIIFGLGSRHIAGQYSGNFNAKKVLIVSDPGVIKAGWTKDIEESLKEEQIDYTVFSDISANPRAEEVMRGAEIYKENLCDLIVAVGGGSPMDCAKGIGIVIANGGSILEYKGIDQIPNPLPPMIFIPTTAGSSADVSQFAIINDQNNLVKIAIVSKIVIPDVALVDPETTLSMPDYLTCCTGMDAMVHAVEAYVSKAHSLMSDVHALEAITLLSENLPKILGDSKNPQLREKIMFASMEAGLAFSNAILGAVHAMAHSLGGFLDLPHGECNSLLLEHVVNYNFDTVPERYRTIAEKVGINTKDRPDQEIKEELFNYFRDLRYSLSISKSLSDVGVKDSDIPVLAQKAIEDACILTNPRTATLEEIEEVFRNAL